MRVIVLGFLLLCFSCNKQQTADLLLKNGKIVTLENDIIAEAVAISADTILWVGSNQDAEKFISEKTILIDLKGAFVSPGWIEGHGHFMNLGKALSMLDLMNVNTFDAIVEMVAKKASELKPGEWIRGRGWHQEKWDKLPEKNYIGMPYHDALTKAAPNNPVLLTHASGHSIIVNQMAMDLAEVNSKTNNPSGGEIIKDKKGNLTGVFIENAMALIYKAFELDESKKSSELIQAQTSHYIDLAMKKSHENGITGFHDAGASFAEIDAFKRTEAENKLKIRLYVMIRESLSDIKNKANSYRIDNSNYLSIRSIKRSIDGALGPHGAWMLAPYNDLQESSGLNLVTIDEMNELALWCIENNFQFNTHAIGDRANRETLDIYEQLFKKNPNKSDLRWRIEHAQHIDLQDIPRFANLGILASMQSVHCTSDGPWVPKRIGEQRSEQGAYVWRKLIESGAQINNGTDVPVESIDPITNFYAAVTRMMNNGLSFYPTQKMTRIETLKSFTINNAYAAFNENKQGSIKPGKWADFTVLDQDLLEISDEKIKETKILYTIVAGKIVYQVN